MAKPSYVLKALNIIDPEEILKFAQIEFGRNLKLKKVVGQSFDVMEEVPHTISSETLATVLSFPEIKSKNSVPESSDPQSNDMPLNNLAGEILSTQELLFQREITTRQGEHLQKYEAIGKYGKSKEMYIVRSDDGLGKKQTRLASTEGVLVDKKQA